jgi:hypothetical protein
MAMVGRINVDRELVERLIVKKIFQLIVREMLSIYRTTRCHLEPIIIKKQHHFNKIFQDAVAKKQ